MDTPPISTLASNEGTPPETTPTPTSPHSADGLSTTDDPKHQILEPIRIPLSSLSRHAKQTKLKGQADESADVHIDDTGSESTTPAPGAGTSSATAAAAGSTNTTASAEAPVSKRSVKLVIKGPQKQQNAVASSSGSSAPTGGSSRGVKRPRSESLVVEEEDELDEITEAVDAAGPSASTATGSGKATGSPKKGKESATASVGGSGLKLSIGVKKTGTTKKTAASSSGKAKADGQPIAKKMKASAGGETSDRMTSILGPQPPAKKQYSEDLHEFAPSSEEIAVLAPLRWIQENMLPDESPGDAAQRWLLKNAPRINMKKNVNAYPGGAKGWLAHQRYVDPVWWIKLKKRDEMKEWRKMYKERKKEIAEFGTYQNPMRRSPSYDPEDPPPDAPDAPTNNLSTSTTNPNAPPALEEPIDLDGVPLPVYPLPTKPFPVMPPIKIASGFAPPTSLDKTKTPIRAWRVAKREIKGIAGGRFFLRTWVGAKESEWATKREGLLEAAASVAGSGSGPAAAGGLSGDALAASISAPLPAGKKPKKTKRGDGVASQSASAGPASRASSVSRKGAPAASGAAEDSATPTPATGAPGGTGGPGTPAEKVEVSAAKALTKMRNIVLPSDMELDREEEEEEEEEEDGSIAPMDVDTTVEA